MNALPTPHDNQNHLHKVLTACKYYFQQSKFIRSRAHESNLHVSSDSKFNAGLILLGRLASKPQGSSQQDESPADDSLVGKSSEEILTRVFLETGLATFFHILERDSTYKQVMLQTLSLSLRAVPPLSLRDLPTLPLNNLRRLNGFLVDTLNNEMSSLSTSDVMVEQAMDSLVHLMMALGYLEINQSFLTLIQAYPSLLQLRHVQSLRNISLMREDNSPLKTPKSKNRKIKMICFLPPFGSDDHVRKTWFRRMKSMLHSFGIFTKDTEVSKAWTCYEKQEDDSAHDILKQLFFPSQDTLLSNFPTPASIREGLEKEFAFEIELRARADAFLDKVESLLRHAPLLSKHIAGAAMILPMMGLARRLRFHDGTNQSVQPNIVPAHVIFGNEALKNLTALFRNLFYVHSDEMMGDCDISSEDVLNLEHEAKILSLISWLSILKVNLNWMLANLNKNGILESKDVMNHVGEVKEILETIIFGRNHNLPEIQPLSKDETVVNVAMDAFSYGVPVIYSQIDELLDALQGLQQNGRNRSQSNSQMIKNTQILLMRRISHCSYLWKLIFGDVPEQSLEVDCSRTIPATLQKATNVFNTFVSEYFDDLHDVLETPDYATLEKRHSRHMRPVGEEDTFWYWDLESSKNISLDETKMIVKKSNGMNAGFIFGSVGFVSGVHSWYVKIDGTPSNVRIGYCRSSDPEQTSNSWHFEFPNTLSERSKQETCSVRVEDKDVVGIHLDLFCGKLDFYKNNLYIGSLQNVNGKVYPFVYFPFSAHNVTISREYKSPTATIQPAYDYSEVLCRFVGTYVNMLYSACQDSPNILMLPFNLAVLEQIYLKFHEFLDWFAGKVQKQDEDTAVLKQIFWSLMNQRLLYADDSKVTHFLPLMAKLLNASSHLSCLPTSSSLFQSVVKCVYSLQEICSHFQDLMTYDGRHFNSFCLQGLRFTSPEFYYRISQPSIIFDCWSLHIILKRELSPPNCVASTVLSTSHFCLQLDERNCRGTIRILETPNNKFYWCSDVSCKIGMWICVSISCQMGKMTLFINGVESGQIPISFPLNLLRIGTASDSSPDDFFCGSIRELHVFDKEKNGEEIFGMINKGMSSGIGHLFSIEFGNKVSDKLLQYGKMRLEISHACKKPMKQRKSELVPLETHWLYEFTKEINALAVRHALLLFRGNNESEEEQLCNKWLNSLLFAQGESVRNDALNSIAFLDGCTDDVYFQMLQPRIGVRLSTELDRLERSIIVVMLYHLQLLDVVESSVTQNSPSNQVELCCRCASIAARNIRRHVMQTKDFYNQSALIEENDNGWDKFCSPILKRCELLLNLPPMTSLDHELKRLVHLQNDEHIGHKSITGMKDLPVELKLTIGAVFEFLKDDIDPETISVSLQKRKQKAKESENGLAALIDLLAVSQKSSLSSDALCLLAYAPNANAHYLSGICSSGLQAEQEVRSKFYSLVTFLLNVGNDESLQPQIRIAALTSLTTLYDHADLEVILSMLDGDHLKSFIPVQSSSYSQLSKTWSQSYEVMKCKNRFLGSLMIGVGMNNRKLHEACKARIASVIGSNIFSIVKRLNFNKLLCNTNNFQSWEGQIAAVCGSILPISMRLTSEYDEILQCKVLAGTVSLNGKIHSVAGKSIRCQGSKELMLLYSPNRPLHGQEYHDVRSKHILIFRCCMLNDFHMSGVLLTANSPQEGKLHRSYFDEEQNISNDFDIKNSQNFQVYKVDRSPVPREFLEKSLPFSSSLTVTPNCIVRCVSSEEIKGIILSNEPVSSTNNFVEMQIVTTSSDPCIAIGIASKPYSYKQMLGWNRESIAYYANNGNLVSQSNFDLNFGTCCGLGDLISCYITFSVEKEPETVVWSKNGQYIGSKDISGLFQRPVYFAFATINTDDGVFISSGSPSRIPLEGLAEEERVLDLINIKENQASMKIDGQVLVTDEGIKLMAARNASSSAIFSPSLEGLDTLIVTSTICLVLNEETCAQGFHCLVLFRGACGPCDKQNWSDSFLLFEIQHRKHESPSEAVAGLEFSIDIRIAGLKYSKMISFPKETVKELWLRVEFYPGGNSIPIFLSDSEKLLGDIPFLVVPSPAIQISNEIECGVTIDSNDCINLAAESEVSAAPQVELTVKHWKVKTKKYESGCQIRDSNLDLCTQENQELKFLLSCVHSVCHDSFFRAKVRSKSWQESLWEMSISESLDVEARLESIKCIVSSIVEDCDKDFIHRNLRKFIDFLTEISPEHLIMKAKSSVNAWNTKPSVVTWYQPPQNFRCDMKGYFAYGKSLPRSSLAFRRKVLQIFASLVVKPYVRDEFTSLVSEHFQQYREFCHRGDCTAIRWGSILALGGILDTLLYNKNGAALNDEFPHSETLVKDFFDTCKVILSCGKDSSGISSPHPSLDSNEQSNSHTKTIFLSMLKARFMKCIWEFTTFRKFQEALSMDGDLMNLVVGSALAASGLPYVSRRISRSQYLFDAQHKSSKTKVYENGRQCEITKNVGQTIMFDPLLYRGSGLHYIELKILTDPASYFLVGCAVPEYPLTKSLGDENGSWAWANDGDTKIEGKWNGQYISKLPKFAEGDHIGMLLDMDAGILKFTKNGELQKVEIDCSKQDFLRFAIGSTKAIKVEIADKCLFDHITLSKQSPSWLTVEKIVAKIENLSLQIAYGVSSPKTLAVGEEIQEQMKTMESPGYHAHLKRFVKENSTMQEWHSIDEDMFSNLSSLSYDWFGDTSKGSEGEDSSNSTWFTTGDKGKLLLSCESFLEHTFARLTILELLRFRMPSCAHFMSIGHIVQLLSYFFPPGYGRSRRIMSSGMYLEITKVLDEALRGWFSLSVAEDDASLSQDLSHLVNYCIQVLEEMVGLQIVQKKGIKYFLCPVNGRIPVSAVSWQLPTKVRIQDHMPENEIEAQSRHSTSLAIWLSSHIAEICGVKNPGIDSNLNRFVETLLMAICTQQAGNVQTSLIQSLQGILRCGKSGLEVSWSHQSQSLIRELHYSAIVRLEKELGSGRSPPGCLDTRDRRRSSELKALVGLLIWIDSSSGMHNDLSPWRSALKQKKNSTNKTSNQKEVLRQLGEMGFSSDDITTALIATDTNELDTLQGEKGQAVIGFLSKMNVGKFSTSSDEDNFDVELCPVLRVLNVNDLSKHTFRQVQTLSKSKYGISLAMLDSLGLLAEALKAFRAESDPPVWLKNCSMRLGADRHQFLTWNDTDLKAGVRVTKNCAVLGLESPLEGEWLGSTGNFPFDDYFNRMTFRIEVENQSGAKMCIGVTNIISHHQDPLYSAHWSIAIQSNPETGNCKIFSLDSEGNVLLTPMDAVCPAFKNGTFVCLAVDRNRILHIHVKEGKEPDRRLDLVARVELPYGGFFVPFAALADNSATCEILNDDSLRRQKETDSKSSQFHESYLFSNQVLCPFRNSSTKKYFDWDQGFDCKQWNVCMDTLLVQYVADRSHPKSKKEITPKNLFDENENVEETVSSTYCLLSRFPSELPPTIPSSPGMNISNDYGMHRDIQSSYEVEQSSLENCSRASVRSRYCLLKAFNKILKDSISLIDLSKIDCQDNLAHYLAYSKGRIFPSVKENLMRLVIHQTKDPHLVPSISLNRGICTADKRKRELTVFWQVFNAVESKKATLRSVEKRGSGNQAWITTFEGEGGSDHGGLFRESVREICAELQSINGSLKLFVPCPNQRMCIGENQDKWIPNIFATSALHLSMFRFVGSLMGMAIRTNSLLELDLASLVWKRLVGELANLSDIFRMDEAFRAHYQDLSSCASERDWIAKGITWTYRSSMGRHLVLIPGGGDTDVQWQDKDKYLAEVVRHRLSEFELQVNAVKEGLHSVVPPVVFSLFTWRELEAKVCGTSEINVEALRKITDHNLPEKERNPVAVMFWKVVEKMTNSDRADLLAFAWGRRRLPPNNSNLRLKIELLSGRGDESLPEAHTCFFAIDLPKYSSEEVMHSKLLYAIRNCSAIDNDFAVQSEILFDAESELLSFSDGLEFHDGAMENEGVDEEVQDRDVGSRKSSQLHIPLDGGHEISASSADKVESDFLLHKHAYKFMELAEAKFGSKHLAGEATVDGRDVEQESQQFESEDEEMEMMWNDRGMFSELDQMTQPLDDSESESDSESEEDHDHDDESGDTLEVYSEDEDDSDVEQVSTEEDEEDEDDEEDSEDSDDLVMFSQQTDGEQDPSTLNFDLLP